MNWIAGKHQQSFWGLEDSFPVSFREVPPFGVDGVRRITTNRSELKKMTAHDYEDMLQVSQVDG
jgi:hypothetical protein